MKTLALLLLLIPYAIAQEKQEKPLPDRWRGMVIDETTPEDAIAKLGKPESDKVDRLRIFDMPDKWITKKQGDKIFRKLKWKQPEGVDAVELSFLNNKLVMIEIDPKTEPAANALGTIYGVDFTPIISSFSQAVLPGNYERDQGKVHPKVYPSVYRIAANSEKSFIGALVSNSGFGAAMREIAGKEDVNSMPGKVSRIQIVSRALENRDGAEGLK